MSGFVIDTKRDVKMPSVGFGCANFQGHSPKNVLEGVVEALLAHTSLLNEEN